MDQVIYDLTKVEAEAKAKDAMKSGAVSYDLQEMSDGTYLLAIYF